MAGTIRETYAANPLAEIGETDIVPIGQDPGGSPADGGINKEDLFIQILTGMQYTLVTSIDSDDLVLELKDPYGDDFSATNILRTLLYDSIVEINSALSVTKADATNWANLGASETATQDIDLFAYLINETGVSAGIKLGWSRVPFGNFVGDFSSTTTNDRYLAGPTNYNATDKVQLIGRFNATLSAGAGYVWTIPATSIILNKPVYSTRWLTWVPTLVGFSADPTNIVYRYKISNDDCIIQFRQGANGTSNATTFTATLPMTAKTITNAVWTAVVAQVVDNTSVLTTPGMAIVSSGGTTIDMRKDTSAAAWAGSGGKRMAYYELRYRL